MNKELERINNKKLTIMLALMFLASLLAFTPEIKAQQPAVDQWSMFHHDSAHTGYSTSTGPLTNQTLWKFKTGNSVEYSSPSIANGVAYVGSQDRTFYALDAATGDKIWSYETGDAIDSYAAVASGVVYIGSEDDYVYALDTKTGDKIWTYKTGADVESFTSVANGIVYIGSNDYYIYAIGAIDAQQPTSPSLTKSPSPTIPEVPYSALTLGLVFGITTAITLISKKVPHVVKSS